MRATALLITILLTMGVSGIALAATAPPDCPGETFQEFITQLQKSKELQQAYTPDTLLTTRLEKGFPMPIQVRRVLHAGEITFPLLPHTLDVKHENLRLDYTDPTGRHPAVKISHRQTPEATLYTFEKAQSCWKLFRIDTLTPPPK